MQLTYGHFAKQSVKAFLRSGELFLFFSYIFAFSLVGVSPSTRRHCQCEPPLWHSSLSAQDFAIFSKRQKQPKCQDAQSYGISNRLQWQCNNTFHVSSASRWNGNGRYGNMTLLTKVAILFCSSSYAISADSIFHFQIRICSLLQIVFLVYCECIVYFFCYILNFFMDLYIARFRVLNWRKKTVF